MNQARDLTPFELKLIADIKKHGCQVLHVFDPQGEEPNFSYSIGFPETLAQPEVIVFSLDKGLMHRMINEIWRQASQDGLQLSDGLRIAGLLEGFDCIAREITDPAAIAEHFGSAIWYHRSQRGQSVERAFQIVWPGARQGLFPWEEGCAAQVITDQPPLYQMSLNS